MAGSTRQNAFWFRRCVRLGSLQDFVTLLSMLTADVSELVNVLQLADVADTTETPIRAHPLIQRIKEGKEYLKVYCWPQQDEVNLTLNPF